MMVKHKHIIWREPLFQRITFAIISSTWKRIEPMESKYICTIDIEERLRLAYSSTTPDRVMVHLMTIFLTRRSGKTSSIRALPRPRRRNYNSRSKRKLWLISMLGMSWKLPRRLLRLRYC